MKGKLVKIMSIAASLMLILTPAIGCSGDTVTTTVTSTKTSTTTVTSTKTSTTTTTVMATDTGTTTTPTSTTTTPTEPVVLTLVKGDTTRELTLSDLKAMNAVEGLGGILSSTGEVSGPFQYKGVSLEDLCQLVGGITSSSVIRAIAKDGYGISFGYRNIVEDDYITYDPTTKREMPHGDLTTILAYEEGGQLLTTQIGGPLRLCVVGSDPLIVDGHWSVKWVNKIEIVEQEISQQNFTLHLVGAITKNIDRASFESCAAPGCHGVSWTDNKGDTWSGVPLWYFVGEVDDETTGDAPGSFNDELVDNGYDVKVIAADDYSVTFASTDVARNPYIFLANEVNGKPLPEDYWPLRVVGPDLAGQQKVGQVVRIEVILP